jgi:uncharacterized protein with GYD domain
MCVLGGMPWKDMKGGNPMATYIMLIRYTQKGIENIKEKGDIL